MKPMPIETQRELVDHYAAAIEFIRKHVPQDALGYNSEGGGDGWNDRSWPLLDEWLHYAEDALAKARAEMGGES